MTNKIIVFPSGMPESIAFYQNNRDKMLVGASAIPDDPANSLYEQWEYLPYVDTADFDTTFLSLLSRVKPNAVYCPHRFASHYVMTLIKKHKLSITLLCTEDEKLLSFKTQQSNQWYASYQELTRKLSIPCEQQLNKTTLVAVIRHALSIPGETGADKIIALLAIGTLISVGDVVEIGCLYGRTSFVFGWIAQRYHVGATLCIDPWSTNEAIHQDTSAMARDAIKENYQYDAIFQQFKESLIPSFFGAFNYMRKTSHEAAYAFKERKTVTTEEFGVTQYTQKISCLHIDGNHDFSAVLDDLTQWNPLLNENAWLILDDYHWPFGDGPKRVGDEILKQNQDNIKASFISGDALFINLQKTININTLFSNEPDRHRNKLSTRKVREKA